VKADVRTAFFEKKAAKKLLLLRAVTIAGAWRRGIGYRRGTVYSKSFLVLFFKKELLAS
jgi:hypothetical protein